MTLSGSPKASPDAFPTRSALVPDTPQHTLPENSNDDFAALARTIMAAQEACPPNHEIFIHLRIEALAKSSRFITLSWEEYRDAHLQFIKRKITLENAPPDTTHPAWRNWLDNNSEFKGNPLLPYRYFVKSSDKKKWANEYFPIGYSVVHVPVQERAKTEKIRRTTSLAVEIGLASPHATGGPKRATWAKVQGRGRR